MRNVFSTISSSLARRVALGCLASFAVLLLAATVVISREAQRGQREQSRQLGQERASLGARAVSARIDAAALVLQSRLAWPGLNERTPMFLWSSLLEMDGGFMLRDGQRSLQLSPAERNALDAGQSVVAQGLAPGGKALYLVKAVDPGQGNSMRIAQLDMDYLWAPLAAVGGPLLAVDSDGRPLVSGAAPLNGTAPLLASAWRASAPSGPAAPLSWQSGGQAWIGALAAVPAAGGTGLHPLAVVSLSKEPVWMPHLTGVLQSMLPVFALALALALCAAALTAQRYVPGLHRLRRALLRLADQQARMPPVPGAVRELEQVIGAFNQTAERIERQRESLHSLTEIDALLIGSGDLESVMDQVLALMRSVMLANNAGLTLVDANAPAHGRLFCVGPGGGSPVTRVNLDAQMIATLSAARTGMTVFRCEELRHSFLAPLQSPDSQFFWVWPVMTGERLAAILAVGYGEPPQFAAQVANYGTECCRRLSASLASSARAEHLYRQAHFDPLTQLPNRLLFRDRLTQELSGNADAGTRGGLLYIDLDNFKRVNDSLGHEAGDQLLAIVAQRLKSCVKDGDTVARLGGDEFTVILRQVVDAGAVAAVADRILQSLQLPVSVAGRDQQIRASIGIALFPDDGATPDALLHNADLAMYRAKEGGRGAATFFERHMADRGTQVADSGLYRALKRREFALFYQPQFAVDDGRLLGVEALLRWQTPRDGLRTPAEFIPAAEESGLIVDLGSWVLDTVCAQYAAWRNEGLDVPRVAVNLSPRQLRDPSLVATVRRILDRYQVPPERIDLELTEAALIDAESQQTVAALAAMGLGLTLDDFGTGHTALNNLRRYPVRAVKIDRSFIEELTLEPSAAALAGTIIVMAHSLGKVVVAEGVETIDQLDFLREHRCDLAQGYYLARPLPVTDLTELLRGQLEPGQDESQIARA